MWSFRRKRSNAGPIGSVAQSEGGLGVLEDMAGSGTSPIISVSVGTTGKNRSALYHLRMSKMGCAERIQSMLVYDCNQLSINALKAGARNDGVSEKMIVPEYLPFSEGFLRRVDQYVQHHGAIERDMENMTEQMANVSMKAGTEPQVFLEWTGYGGHAHLSRMMHDIATERYPESMVLPVVCFPDDRSMHRNIREHGLWGATEDTFRDLHGAPYPMLLTDNRRGTDVNKLDEALVTTLASVEACFKSTQSMGSLAEVASEFKNEGCGWIVVESGVIPVLDRRALQQRTKKQSDEDHRKAIGKMAQRIKQSIKDIAEPLNRFDKSAFFTPGTRESEQRIYVVMPYTDAEMKGIRDDIEDQLGREGFKDHFPGTKVGYAPGNPECPSRPDGWQYVHISKLVGLPLHPLPESITSILYDQPLQDVARRAYFDRRNGAGPQPATSNGHVINDESQIPPAEDSPDPAVPTDAESRTVDTSGTQPLRPDASSVTGESVE